MVNLGMYANGYTEAEGNDVVNVISTGLKMAKTYMVEPAMISEIMACAETEIDESRRFGQHTAPPSPYGFMYFPTPIEHMERRGRRQFIHAFAWCATRDKHDDHGFSMAMFNDINRQPDEVMIEGLGDRHFEMIVSRAGGWSPVGLVVVGNNGKLGPYRIYCTPEERKIIHTEGDTPMAYTVNMSHVVLATSKLMAETIDYGDTSQTEQFDRALRRRAKRTGVTSKVNVVLLRRLRHRTKNPRTGKPLEWRQPVCGYYRMQAYGPGRKLRRKIWIDDFEQGPEGALYRPAKDTVTKLTR